MIQPLRVRADREVATWSPVTSGPLSLATAAPAGTVVRHSGMVHVHGAQSAAKPDPCPDPAGRSARNLGATVPVVRV